MNPFRVKAILNNNEVFTPTEESFAALSEFYGILEGYFLKGREFGVYFGSGVHDRNEREVFEGDIVDVFTRSKDGNFIKETGVVQFDRGTFVIHNEHGMEYELGSCALDPDNLFVDIVGNIYVTKDS